MLETCMSDVPTTVNHLIIPQNFLMGDEMEANEGRLEVAFASLRSGSKELHFKMEADGTVELLCDDLDVVGDIVQVEFPMFLYFL